LHYPSSRVTIQAVGESQAPRLLVVEDEEHLAAGLKLNFELEGYDVVVAGSSRDAGAAMLDEGGPFSAVILDVMLPDASGFEFCRKLRDAGNFVPVLMLTALGATDDRVRGLEAGADDYLTKPFELDELLARVRSMLRRQGWVRNPEQRNGDAIVLGGATVDFASHEVHHPEREIHLTRLEFDLLRYFARNPGRTLTRVELQRAVWKLENYPTTRAVDNFIVRLRRHFEPDPRAPRYFVSVRGFGYKFVPHE
jgi:DNA-binding response OmpR family regulator